MVDGKSGDGWIDFPDGNYDVIGILPCELRVERNPSKTGQDIDRARATGSPVLNGFPSLCIEGWPSRMDRGFFLDVGQNGQNHRAGGSVSGYILFLHAGYVSLAVILGGETQEYSTA